MRKILLSPWVVLAGAVLEAVSGIGQQIAEVAKALSDENGTITSAISNAAAISQQATAAAEVTTSLVAEQESSLVKLQQASETLMILADKLRKHIGKFTV